ncbi:hypothetical protein [Curtobacterium sp. Leaf261]|uniref:hypothetical protein n=1 Tax=Curtobacterium sp. Leaf261 TaxID=1736311 RepID=UPI0012E1FEF4|nr:hypothetical protein [Curtobacterium sp. Leaf261]
MVDIEHIIRTIVREELERALNPTSTDPITPPLSPEQSVVDDTRLVLDVSAVAALTGMSKQYIRNDIRDEHLAAGRLHGKKFVIERLEALRYAKWLAAGRP